MKDLFALVCYLLVGSFHLTAEATTSEPSTTSEKDFIDSEVTLGATPILTCGFQADYTPKAIWLKDGSPLPDNSKFKVIEKYHEDGTSLLGESEIPLVASSNFKKLFTVLTIENIQIEDSGIYTCQQTNSQTPGFPRKNIKLKVNGKQIISSFVGNVNETKIFLCRFESLFEPEVVWLKDGSPLPQDPKFDISEDLELFSKSESPLLAFIKVKRLYTTLKIENLQMDDSGIYSCEQTNSATPGFPRKNFSLKVKENQVIKKELKVNQSALFFCQFQNVGRTPEITWLRNGSPLPDAPKFSVSESLKLINKSENPLLARLKVIHLTTTLKITDLQIEDSGSYSCEQSNSPTPGIPRKDFSLKVIESQMVDLEWAVGETPLLTCQASVQITPEVIWLKDGSPLKGGLKFRMSETIEEGDSFTFGESNYSVSVPFKVKSVTATLKIVNVQIEDSGIYSCQYLFSQTSTIHKQDFRVKVKDTLAASLASWVHARCTLLSYIIISIFYLFNL